MKKLLITTCIIFLAAFVFFFSNIKGYYRFKQYCEAEGGLRVYEPLERNVGWLAKDEYEAKQILATGGVGFVQLLTNSGIGTSAEGLGLLKNEISADIAKTIKYRWVVINPTNIKGEFQLNKFGFEVYNVVTNSLAVRYYMFEYSIFSRSNTVLGAPSSKFCFSESGESVAALPLSLKKIKESFINN